MRIALIGNPIAHSKSPLVYSYIFQRLGYPLQFESCVVCEKTLSSKIDQLYSFDAFLVTTPLKELIVPFMSTLSQSAKLAGAVNFVICNGRDLHGYNTDGFGALECIEKHILVKQRHVLVLGSGGAASSICFEAKRRNANVYIHNRTLFKAKALASRVGATVQRELLPPYDVVIQATSVGLDSNTSNTAVNKPLFKGVKLALEINYATGETAFENYARGQTEHVVLAGEMYYFMVKQQIQILLNTLLDDAFFFQKILKIFRDVNT